MRFIVFIFFVSLFGCGKKFDTVHDAEPLYTKTNNPTEFLSQTKEYIELKSTALNNNLSDGQKYNAAFDIMNRIPINFHDVKTLYPNDNFVAVCRKSKKSGKAEILIDSDYWKNHSNLRTAMILHELGHCDLNREHFTIFGDRRSIMEAVLITIYPTKSIYELKINQDSADNKNDLRIKNCLGTELFKSNIPCIP